MANDNIIKFTELSAKLNTTLASQIKVLDGAATNLNALNTAYAKLPSEYFNAIKQGLEIEKKKVQVDKELITLEQKKTDLTAKAARAEKAQIQTKAAKIRLSEQEIRVAAKAATVSEKLSNEYLKQSKILNDLRLRYKHLALAEGESSKEARKLLIQITALDSRLKKVDANVGQFQRNVGNYGSAMRGAVGAARSLAGAMGLLSGSFLVVGVFRDALRTVKDYDAGLKDVSKTTGLTGEGLKKLGNDVINLSQKLKVVGVKQLLSYATVAGQLGVKGSKDITAFAESLALLETATDVAGEEGGRNIARLLTIVDGGVQNVGDFSDEIVRLGNNFAATENEILGNATAIAQNTGVFKLGRQEVLAYATATKAVGLEAEIVGSTIGRSLSIFENAIRTGKNLNVVTELLGKNQEELGKAFKENSSQVLTEFIGALSKVDKEGGSVLGTLDELGITAVRDKRVIASLATGGYDVLTRALNDVSDASGAALEEFETASGKLSLAWGKLTNTWDRFILSIEKGEGVISKATLSVLNFFEGAIDGLTRFNRAFDEQLDINKSETFNKTLKEQNKLYKELGDSAERVALERADRARDEVDATNAEIKALREKNIAIQQGLSGSGQKVGNATDFERNRQSIEQLTIKLAKYEAVLQSSEAVIEQTDESQKSLNTTNEEAVEILTENIIQREKLKALFKDVLDGFTKEKESIEGVDKAIQNFTGSLEKMIGFIDLPPLETGEYENSLTDLQLATDDFLNNLGFKSIEDSPLSSLKTFFDGTFEDLILGANTTAEEFAVSFNAIGEVAKQTFAMISQMGEQNMQQELDILQTRYENQLMFAGEGTAARERLEEQYESRRRAIQLKQAKAQKAQALFSAGITTGQAALAAYASQLIPGDPTSLIRAQVAAGIAAAFGLLQVGFIASQQIPEFKDGVRGFEGGAAIVGDGGVSEIVRTKKGVYATPNKDTLVNLPKGADVFKNHEEYYNSVMGDMGVLPSIPKVNVVNNGLTKLDLDQVMSKHFSNIQTNQTVIDKNGLNTYVKKQNSKTTSLNNRVSFKGFSV